MRVGVFGGSFDPIHLGHLVIAETAREALALDTVLFLPARVPPHKPQRVLADAGHRWRMVQLACEGNSVFQPSRRELDAVGPTYTVDTLRALHAEARQPTEFFLVIGADSFRDLHTWREPDVIRTLARLAVAPRPGVAVPPVSDAIPLPSPALAISASEVRGRVAEGLSIRYLVPDVVRAYILAHGLYRDA